MLSLILIGNGTLTIITLFDQVLFLQFFFFLSLINKQWAILLFPFGCIRETSFSSCEWEVMKRNQFNWSRLCRFGESNSMFLFNTEVRRKAFSLSSYFISSPSSLFQMIDACQWAFSVDQKVQMNLTAILGNCVFIWYMMC